MWEGRISGREGSPGRVADVGQGPPEVPKRGVQCLWWAMALDVGASFHWRGQEQSKPGLGKVPRLCCVGDVRRDETVRICWVVEDEAETAADGVLSMQLPC